ncbi:MAG: carbon starvation protein A [Rikenellaceae bacterium]|jgi:carbon starvation protein CstA|nr:carbon starvation protein A [Rikenellaceae bacterium]
MITFLVCLALLVGAYFTYGRYLARVAGINPANPVPSATLYDGVDYVPMPRWRTFLVQLLNIAGLGPVFGAILGAAYGPVAFVWITLGGIFFGAMHDFMGAVLSLRSGGRSLPEVVGEHLGVGVKQVMRLFSVLLMVLVGAVFMSQPAELLAWKIPMSLDSYTDVMNGLSGTTLLFVGIILVYYVVATLLPVDKLIGRIYPVFGFLLFFMALGIMGALLFGGYQIPELTSLKNQIADAGSFPIVPTLFVTIACGAISGFHATQSPLMVRCIRSESEARSVFFGGMIAESIIALIWAAIAMAFWGGVVALNETLAANSNKAALLVDMIANQTLGSWLAYLVVFGVIAAAITSGDTAFRSARLIVADFTGVEQRTLWKRVAVSAPLFALGVSIILFMDFRTMWSYFAWMNQSLAVITLWTITVWLFRRRKPFLLAMIPAVAMTYICASYAFISPIMVGMANRPLAYLLGGVVTLVVTLFFTLKFRKPDAVSTT